MPTARNEAIVKPELLSWARESAGLALEEAAKKIPIRPERLLACEQGAARLTIPQLRTLSNVYKRPLAFFFLPSPPEQEKSLHDYRRLPNQGARDTSPDLRAEIRKAKYRREVAIDLFQEMGIEPSMFSAETSLESDVNHVADRIRTLLRVTIEQQTTLRTRYEALNFWRDGIEELGILVFQSSLALKEMRGFSIWYSPLPLIVVNTKDTPSARIFSMLHELTHLMLRSTGLCILQDRDKTEVFCNAVAGATLVPERYFLNESAVIANKGKTDWTESVIKSLAARYRVSREVILRRLLSLGRTNNKFYLMKMALYEKEYERIEYDKILNPESDPIPFYLKTIGSTGKTFARLVVESYHQNKINLSDVSQYLGVKLKHLGNIEEAIISPSGFVGELS